MLDVDILSSVPMKIDKGCSYHGESYPCSYMPYYITVPFLPLSGYEIGHLLTNCLHSFDIPPDVRNTAGVEVAFSTFDTLYVLIFLLVLIHFVYFLKSLCPI